MQPVQRPFLALFLRLTLDDFEGERFKRIAHIKKLIADGVVDSKLRRVAALALHALTFDRLAF